VKFRGGYNILLEGKPALEVKPMPEQAQLYLPLHSRRFAFAELCVSDGRSVKAGDILARDADNYSVPLLAPRGGTVRLRPADDCIVLEKIACSEEPTIVPEQQPQHIAQMGAEGGKRYRLLELGAWQFFEDAYTGDLPDPFGTPQAVIVSTVSLEPFVARGDAQLYGRLLNFTRGLEHLQGLLEYQPIYLVMPNIRSEFAARLREQIRGYAWVNLIEIPLKYPSDNFNILARSLGLKKKAGTVWAVRTDGVMAVDRALTQAQPSLSRVISIGGPVVKSPVHIETVPGYPIQAILDMYVSGPGVRIINGGLLTGRRISADTLGLDTECRGLTILAESADREPFAFIRPGWDRSSYSKCFLSSLGRNLPEKLTAAMRGEVRPCISCGFCEKICPAGIMPHLLHKYLYQDMLEQAEKVRLDLCIGCGLCSFVCPSKIELRDQFIQAQQMLSQQNKQLHKNSLEGANS
jgi:Na(+)-translocating NADH:ubiquinone oxidoreductase A subunit